MSKLRKTCKGKEHRAIHRDIENVMAFQGDSDFFSSFRKFIVSITEKYVKALTYNI